MKHMINFYLILALCLTANTTWTQTSELTIPFSDPAEQKFLDIEVFSGTIKITGTDRTDILVIYELVEDDHREEDHEADEKSGLRKISGSNMNLEMGEKNNKAYITSKNWMKPISLEIQVPKELTLDIEKNMGDLINVSNVHGDLNVECAVGSITIEKARGIVNASTSAGEIKIEFEDIPDPKSMIITNHTGDIDLTLPSSYKADLKMKTNWGEIYSDLDITTIPTEPKMEKSTEVGEFKVVTDSWTKAKLNGGGSELTLKTMMGNIYLRKKE